MNSGPVSIPLDCETIDALEARLALCAAPNGLMLPDVEFLPLGTALDVVLRLSDGSAALSLRVFVEWRHPAAAPPPGRAPRTGLVILQVDEASQALWDRIVERGAAQGGPDVCVEGSASVERMPRVPQLESRWGYAPADEGSAAARRALSDQLLTRTLKQLGRGTHGGGGQPRAIPSPTTTPIDAPPRPELMGTAFLFEYPGRRLVASIGRLERFAWPLFGTLRPSRSDVRTSHD
ncbi:MAG: hypothetical protein ACO3JL_19630, partial [Myxococcota bacterium]